MCALHISVCRRQKRGERERVNVRARARRWRLGSLSAADVRCALGARFAGFSFLHFFPPSYYHTHTFTFPLLLVLPHKTHRAHTHHHAHTPLLFFPLSRRSAAGFGACGVRAWVDWFGLAWFGVCRVGCCWVRVGVCFGVWFWGCEC